MGCSSLSRDKQNISPLGITRRRASCLFIYVTQVGALRSPVAMSNNLVVCNGSPLSQKRCLICSTKRHHQLPSNRNVSDSAMLLALCRLVFSLCAPHTWPELFGRSQIIHNKNHLPPTRKLYRWRANVSVTDPKKGHLERAYQTSTRNKSK